MCGRCTSTLPAEAPLRVRASRNAGDLGDFPEEHPFPLVQMSCWTKMGKFI